MRKNSLSTDSDLPNHCLSHSSRLTGNDKSEPQAGQREVRICHFHCGYSFVETKQNVKDTNRRPSEVWIAGECLSVGSLCLSVSSFVSVSFQRNFCSISRSFGTSIGLARCPFMPAERAFRLSSSKAFAVSATIGIPAAKAFGSARIARVAS